MNIAILGLGAMGSRMAARLVAAGHQVAGWNRSAIGAPKGTSLARTPAEAVADAEIVIAMVRDDDASHAVWQGADGALAAMRHGALAVECSTITQDRMLALGAAATAAGVRVIDAPVLGSRPQADAGQLIHLIGGDAADVALAEPALATLSAARLHAGPLGAGAALKLVANTLFAVQVAAVAELVARMRRLGLDPAQAMDLLAATPVLSPAAKGAAALMLAGKHEPLFPVALVAKDLGYAVDAPAATPIAQAALAVFEQAAATGMADRNLTVVAQAY